jgi:hypothetical protein
MPDCNGKCLKAAALREGMAKDASQWTAQALDCA